MVGVPEFTDGITRPYPLRPDSISLVTFGRGWVLSVPSHLITTAEALCRDLSFSDLVRDGDTLLETWFAQLASNKNVERPGAQAYRVLAQLTDPRRVRGWSHYVHWYCSPSSHRDKPVDAHVRAVNERDPKVWIQWLHWPGPFCRASFAEHFDVSNAFGYVLNGTLVSVAQLQTSLQEFAWEFGVDTLAQFRRRGFATQVARAATAFIIKRRRIPWYYYDHYNHASAGVPQKLGYLNCLEGVFSHAASHRTGETR